MIQPTQPFPFLSNLSLSLAFRLRDERSGESVEARVKVPRALPQWVPLSADIVAPELVFVRLHEVIRENAHKLYQGMRLSAPTLFRLTRDAEVELQENTDQGLRELVREQIRQRRYELAVRLEFGPDADAELRQLLQERLRLDSRDVYDLAEELDYTSLFHIAALRVPELRDPPFASATPSRLVGEADLFGVIHSRASSSSDPPTG